MKRLLTVAVLVLVASYAMGQGSTPESTMVSYADAAKSWDVGRMANLMHPEALRRFREAFDGAFLGENASRARTDLLPLFAVSTYEDYAALSNVEVFQRLTETVSRAAPGLKEIMAGSEYEIVSQAQRGEEVLLTYVLAITVEGRVVRQEVEQALKQHEGKWLLMLPADGEATIARIAAQY